MILLRAAFMDPSWMLAMNNSWRVPRDKSFEPFVAFLCFCLCDCISLSPLEAMMLTAHQQKGDGNFILAMLLIKDLDPITRSIGKAPYSELWCFQCQWKIPLSKWISFSATMRTPFPYVYACSQPHWILRAFFFPFNFWSNFNYAEEVNADIQNNFI